MSAAAPPSPSPAAAAPAKHSADDFEIGEALGEGAYSRVALATLKSTGEQFAVKILDKKFIVQKNKVHVVRNEKQILNMLEHPNIISLHSTFQDSDSLYFVLELGAGGEMFDYLQRFGPFTIQSARFYIAEVINALEYMHSKGVVHRDLKPENILFSKDMHVKVSDFGAAKLMDIPASSPSPSAPSPPSASASASDVSPQSQDESSSSSSSSPSAAKASTPNYDGFAGTAEYVSPEVLSSSESSPASDLWAVGCILYQLLVGRPPFQAESEYLIFQKIKNLQWAFPPSLTASSSSSSDDCNALLEDAKDLITKLMVKNPNERLGANNAYSALKSHPFFKGIDFNTLSKQTPPPFAAAPSRSSSLSSSLASLSVSGSSSSSSPSPSASSPKPAKVDSAWASFLGPRESIVYRGLVIKRRRMSWKKRELVLTTQPRLFYVDPDSMQMKGWIPWEEITGVELKSDKDFIVCTPSRNYVLEDIQGRGRDWSHHINAVLKASSSSSPSQPQ